MLNVAISEEERTKAYQDLRVAEIILNRAVLKYKGLSQGGLQRALDRVVDAIELIAPSSDLLLLEVEGHVSRMREGREKDKTREILTTLKYLVSRKDPDDVECHRLLSKLVHQLSK